MQGEVLNNQYQVKTQLSKRGARETLLAQDLDTQALSCFLPLKYWIFPT